MEKEVFVEADEQSRNALFGCKGALSPKEKERIEQRRKEEERKKKQIMEKDKKKERQEKMKKLQSSQQKEVC